MKPIERTQDQVDRARRIKLCLVCFSSKRTKRPLCQRCEDAGCIVRVTTTEGIN